MSLTKVSYSMITGSPVNVLDYGAVGNGTTDDTAAIQAAITVAAGRPVYVPAGTYRINNQLSYFTAAVLSPGLKLYGDGMGKTVFDTRVSAASMLFIRGGTGSSTFQYGGYLRDFSIVTNGVPATADGIEMQSIWHCNVERVQVIGLSNRGIYVHNDVAPGDPDSCAYLMFDKCRITSNKIGFSLVSTTNSLGITFINITNSEISGNTTSGIKGVGVSNVIVYGNGIVANGAVGSNGGAHFTFDGVSNQQIHFTNNEFGNGNNPWNCKLESALGGSFSGNLITQNTGEAGTSGFILGDGVNPSGYFNCVNNRFRIASTINPFTAFTFASLSRYSGVTNTFWSQFDATGQTRFTSSGTGISIVDENATRGSALQFISTSTATGSYTADIANATHHRVVITATGAFAMNAPVGSESGRELELDIVNSSGGAITITFNAVFAMAGYADPANGKRRTAKFTYDPNSLQWVLIGSWSPDI